MTSRAAPPSVDIAALGPCLRRLARLSAKDRTGSTGTVPRHGPLASRLPHCYERGPERAGERQPRVRARVPREVGHLRPQQYDLYPRPDDARREILAITATGDWVSILLMGRAPTNKVENYENIYGLFFEVRDRKIHTQVELLDFRVSTEM